MSKLPVGSVWGVVGDTSTWMRVNSVDEMIKVSSFVGHVQWYNPKSHNFPPAGYVRIDSDITAIGDASADDVWDEVVEALQAAWPNETLHWNESPRELITRLINERDELNNARKPSIIRTDTEGRDVTDLPGLWSEDDTITDLSQPFTVEWLCEIGGVKGRLAGQEVIQFHSKSYGAFSIDTWNFGYWKGESVPGNITTRGDVLKWLDVLGIVPNSKGSK